MKKRFVLVTLFVLPVVVYLFFASGVYNFGKLPILTESIADIADFDSSISLQNKITILGFMGNNVTDMKGNAFNLNQKIYKRFYEFDDLQFVMIASKGMDAQTKELKKELAGITNVEKWNFVFLNDADTNALFESLHTNLTLDDGLSTPYVFIIDKNKNLRGRNDDEDGGTKYGFNTTSVADLNNKMEDDVKIILAEYRLALKKNNVDRTK